MNILMNNQNNLSVNTKRFKCVGLLVILSTLTSVTISRAMEEKREEMVRQTTNKKEANKKLFAAGTLKAVEEAINEGADINAKDYCGRTLLNLACKKGYIEVALKLIEKGANVNVKTSKGKTPLHFACKKNLETVALKLIEKEADVNSRNYRDLTPLHLACRKRLAVDVALKLIEKGANVNAAIKGRLNEGWTPLHFACRNDLAEVALKLVEKGADVNAKDSIGRTPLNVACLIDSIDIVKLLLENSAYPDAIDKYGETPAQKTRTEEIRDMLNLISNYLKESKKAGFDINKFIAAQKLPENVELLLKFRNAIFKKQPLELPKRTDRYNDSIIICEKEKLERNEN